MPDGRSHTEVCVIVPVHDGEPFLHEALAGLDDQTFAGFETVIVDDGSQDRSRAIIEEWVRRSPQCRRQLDTPGSGAQGVAAARNLAIANTNRRWLAFCDQDDIWHPEKLARQIETVRASPHFDLIATVPELLVQTGQPDPSLILWHAMIEALATDPVVELTTQDILSSAPICLSSAMVRRDALVEAGGFSSDLRWTSDWEAWLRLSFGRRIALMADPLVRYRLHGANEFQRMRSESAFLDEVRTIHDRLACAPNLVGCASETDARRKIERMAAPAGGDDGKWWSSDRPLEK
ncbi:glycosyltransferase [Erythrobacter sp. JK5]|uniref:glycosyltransferase family 2 protein n=1 Tax=Erythrobacter sp. JK5 TaxID=2829500 RepID=UPI001BA47075|nr:glycosyltransferase [Erythrobacter sp. JK5]QUL37956.1 glycosyltransferase [Erythrobacter sp. JK5]